MRIRLNKSGESATRPALPSVYERMTKARVADVQTELSRSAATNQRVV